MSSVVPPACAREPGSADPLAGGGVSDTTAGSTRITAYPAVAPAPNAGVNTRTGELITPSATASLIASGMLAAEAGLPRDRLYFNVDRLGNVEVQPVPGQAGFGRRLLHH